MSHVSPEFEAALRDVLDALRRDPRVRHAEVRFVDETVEHLSVRSSRQSGRLDHVTSSRSRGVGIRVLGARTWGFACTATLTREGLRTAAERAASIAAASSERATRIVAFEERSAERGTYTTPDVVDPFAVSVEEKLAALDAPVGVLATGPSELLSAEAGMEWRRIDKWLLTTEGTDVRQTFFTGACGMRVVAAGAAGPPQTRSYPTWNGADAFQGGFEHIAALNLATHAPELRDEALALTTAPPCPSGVVDVILESSQVALQVHESCGHPTELDRVFGTEITLAGGSFLDPQKLGSFRYGSNIVTLTCDSVTPGGLGTFGWDDEGTPAAKHALVEAGIFVDYLSSRETAAAIDRRSTGTMRASGFNRTPLIRMTNVSLAPGHGSLDDLVRDTRDGVLIATDRSWSIDDQRLDFHFGCEIAWEIKNGKRTRMLQNPVYFGTTPTFWGSCDAIAGPEEFRMWGVASCGKGDPIQIIGVGHGASPARFRKVNVGSSS